MPKLTEDLARRTSPPATGQKLIFDTETKGFGLRITKGGVRTWLAEVHVDGRSHRHAIGRVGEVACAEARKQAMALRLAGAKGADPQIGKRTVADLYDASAKEDAARLAPRSLTEQEGVWRRYIKDRIGDTKLTAVTARTVAALLAEVKGDVSANRTHELLRKMFGRAVAWKWLTTNPAIGWERRRETPRSTYLERDELGRLLGALPTTPPGDALRFAALTGARLGEVLGMTRGQIRDGGAIWIKPAATTKQRREHIVPLAPAAQEVIARQPTHSTGLVFAREDGERIASVRKTLAWALKRADLKSVRVHDLRHSFASVLVNSGASLALVGAALGHSSPTITARYSHLATEALRQAIDGATGNVVPLRPRKSA